MAKATYRNSRNDDTVTLDLSTEDGKRDAKRLDKLDNWSKAAEPKASAPPPAPKLPGPKAKRAELLSFVKEHASDSEQAAVEQMDDDALRAYVDGKRPAGV